MDFENHPVTWLGLEIQERNRGEHSGAIDTVHFIARYIENGVVSELSEVSEFIKEDGLWYYLKGDCTVKKNKQGRNNPCPCGSGKKFKRCCLAK